MTQFTANEVRDEIAGMQCAIDNAGFGSEGRAAFASYAMDNIGKWKRMLRAFADLLEAQERAVPVRQFRVVPKGSTWTDVKDDEIWTAVTAHPESYETRILYTHPDPADAERLAEALQPFANLLQPHHASIPDDRPIYGINKAEITAGDLRRANEALAAHSAQAQPPAASVMDAIAHRMVAEYDAVLCGDPTATRTEGMRAALEAALDTQESPNG